MVLTERSHIHVSELPDEIRGARTSTEPLWPSKEISLKANTRALEKALIERALRETDNNRTRTAKLLGISHPTLLSKMKTYGIS